MVPRAFLFSSAPPHKPFQSHGMKPSRPSDGSDLHLSDSKTETRGSINTIPVGIPPKRGSRTLPARRDIRSRALSKTSESSHRSSSSSSNDRPIPTSFTSMLDATAIPVPRRNWSTRRPRKLPRGNHAEDFSRMLQEDIKSKEDTFLDGAAYSPLDILLSPPDEDNQQLLPCNDSDESPPSVKSSSSDSMPSLEHALASPSSLPSPPTPPRHRSPPERRQPRYSHCEECALDHPLLVTEIDECDFIEINNDNEPATPEAVPAKRSASFGRLGSTFKSNLTASLRAIKSAAQSVFDVCHTLRPTRGLPHPVSFHYHPRDDRRPPPFADARNPFSSTTTLLESISDEPDSDVAGRDVCLSRSSPRQATDIQYIRLDPNADLSSRRPRESAKPLPHREQGTKIRHFRPGKSVHVSPTRNP